MERIVERAVEQVSFTRMADGTRADYELLERFEESYIAGLPERILAALRKLDSGLSGYRVSRLEHSLQSASRAQRNGEDEELVVAALLHDLGDELAPYSHSEFAAAILRPYVSEKTYWIVKHHGLFQMVYYAHHLGLERNGRRRFEGHPYYQDTVAFCERYDQNCFDPDYDSLPLEFFEPMVHRVFGRAPHDRERV